MDFAQLALVCLVAILGPALSLSKTFRVPVVVGELAVGLVLGRTGFAVLDPGDPVFSFLAEIGFVLVMFVAGSAVPLQGILSAERPVLPAARALLVGVAALPLGYAVAALIGSGHGALYAVLIASSSASIILPTVEGAPMGGRSLPEMIPQVALADAACLVLLPLAADRAHLARALSGTALVLGAGVVAFVLLKRLEESGARREVHDVSEERGLALELRFLLTAVFALAALATATGVSTMLAGFVLGVGVATVGQPRRVAKQFFALTEGFFGPIFFVWIGAGLDLLGLLDNPRAIGWGIALWAAALLAHGAIALTGQPLPIALTTSAQMGVPIGAVAMLLKDGGAVPGEDTAILLGAVFTIATTALVHGRVLGLAAREADGAGNDSAE